MFKKILIANRGEIAHRIIKACREMSITSAVIYSEADVNALHVRRADEAYLIGAAPASDSYLNKEKIIALAKQIGADAIHPGYGFLSERAEFIKMVEDAGITFIGPSYKSVEMMGGKTDARTLMKNHNVPIVPGTTEPITDIEEGKKTAKEIGFPVMLKAAAGGGGKGMRKVFSEVEFEPSFLRAKNEALKFFGNDAVYIEKFIEHPKHIEVQIIADKYGNYVHLFERECSVQRRHQKVIEEAPSISVDNETRIKLTEAAVNAAKACGYYNAGTIEMLMDKDKSFYFLEMNTRLQVEHPVTEMITGFDIVKEQIRIAYGEKLSITQDEIKINGHAIECRVYAEDVDNNYAPSIGKITHHRLTSGPGVRIDRGIDVMSEVPIYYDPMLAKVICWGKDRDEAIERMKRALCEYQICGVTTNMPAFNWMLKQKTFVDGTFDINFLDNEFLPLIPDKWKGQSAEHLEDVAAVLAALIKNVESDATLTENHSNRTNNWRIQLYE
ncbi:MAG: acetyl-CoA carboxylase biotin carboxylase subunit [Ignavibacteria bacterium]|nr:MAG: acetyl-CoA carboxylase biotin carboxylase subunit [Ignavibacteria bacterium]KAF0162117.1 MAG: acetyl-CoA carboxylase biotin carboxylase subunit [Ignavibacteria bacterium]